MEVYNAANHWAHVMCQPLPYAGGHVLVKNKIKPAVAVPGDRHWGAGIIHQELWEWRVQVTCTVRTAPGLSQPFYPPLLAPHISVWDLLVVIVTSSAPRGPSGPGMEASTCLFSWPVGTGRKSCPHDHQGPTAGQGGAASDSSVFLACSWPFSSQKDCCADLLFQVSSSVISTSDSMPVFCFASPMAAGPGVRRNSVPGAP